MQGVSQDEQEVISSCLGRGRRNAGQRWPRKRDSRVCLAGLTSSQKNVQGGHLAVCDSWEGTLTCGWSVGRFGVNFGDTHTHSLIPGVLCAKRLTCLVLPDKNANLSAHSRSHC